MVEQSEGNGKAAQDKGAAWYCVRSRRKQEHVAAAHVKILGNIPVFCPRIRFRRATKTGSAVKVTEALFPGYFFAQFNLGEMLPLVRSAHGVSTIVKFGDWYPVIENSIIEALQVESGSSPIAEVMPDLVPGDRVRLVVGPLAGLEAIITHVLPGNERVKLLLEFLGGNTLAEARTEDLIPHEPFGSAFFRFSSRLATIGRGSRLNGAKVRLPEVGSMNGDPVAGALFDERQPSLIN
jgi:transcriptional antiterminator RfaH